MSQHLICVFGAFSLIPHTTGLFCPSLICLCLFYLSYFSSDACLHSKEKDKERVWIYVCRDVGRSLVMFEGWETVKRINCMIKKIFSFQ